MHIFIHIQVFKAVSNIWASIIEAASPFICKQRSPDHFEFFGLDIIIDKQGGCWLLEANRFVLFMNTCILYSLYLNICVLYILYIVFYSLDIIVDEVYDIHMHIHI
jgi:hypothetical protein